MKNFQKNIVNVYGDRASIWLAELPQTIGKIAKKYDLSDLIMVPNLSFNYVGRGYQNSKPIILKVGLDHKALKKEAHCLSIFAKHRGVKVLVIDDGVLIIERAIPGLSLKDYFPKRDHEAVNILSSVIKELHSAQGYEDHDFYRIEDLVKTLDKEIPIPKKFLSKARFLRDKLLGSVRDSVLLHGDLHHDNILKSGDDWVIIDPKGFIGDPVFEICAFLSNPIPELLDSKKPNEIINQRILLCAESLGFSEQRIRDWHYVHSVLCWAWQLEDHLNPHHFIRLLNTITAI